ncbi:regulator of chromosome condensation 1/beta-lactamase-inhibitor protein II, partial [Coemansia spiralis]
TKKGSAAVAAPKKKTSASSMRQNAAAAKAKERAAVKGKKAPAITAAVAAAKPTKKAAPQKQPAKPKKALVSVAAEPRTPAPPVPTPFLKARTAPVHSLAERPKAAGKAYVFGNGDCGQLGLGDEMIERKKPFPLPAISDKDIVDITCGGLHSMALTSDGQLWSWGCNDQKALGRDGDEFTPAPVSGLDNVRITKAACSDSATFALSDDGHVYSWGTFRSSEGIMGFSEHINIQEQPMVINEFREPIVDLCAGADHALALSVSGKVYAWGYGQQGQLGRLIMERRRLHGLTPERLRLVDIQHIGSGAYHSFAVAKDGTVYAWGLNNFRQLGLAPKEGGNDMSVHEPTPISALKDAGVVMITGGMHHSIALTADGKLYAFGRSDSHQTGLPFSTLPNDAAAAADGEPTHKKAISVPTLIPSISGVADVVCGSNHNIALTADGKAYAWGYGEMLQLGNGEEEDVEQPMLLQGQKIEGKRILKVAAGGQHSVI